MKKKNLSFKLFFKNDYAMPTVNLLGTVYRRQNDGFKAFSKLHIPSICSLSDFFPKGIISDHFYAAYELVNCPALSTSTHFFITIY